MPFYIALGVAVSPHDITGRQTGVEVYHQVLVSQAEQDLVQGCLHSGRNRDCLLKVLLKVQVGQKSGKGQKHRDLGL